MNESRNGGQPTAQAPSGGRGRGWLGHLIIVATATCRTAFWLLCLHLFGAKALLTLLAAWTLLNGVRDLTFARVRLARLLEPARRRATLRKSIAIEGGIAAVRLGVGLLLVAVLGALKWPVADHLLLLLPCILLWSRETLLVLVRVYEVAYVLRFVRLSAAITGLAVVLGLYEAGASAIAASVTGLVAREAVFLLSYCLAVLAGRLFPSFRGRVSASDLDADGDGQEVGNERHLQGLRTSTHRFLIDNVTFARWRIMQIGSRAVANGLLGPFGTIVSNVFFSYRQPGAWRPGPSGWKPIVAFAALAALLVGAVLTWRPDLLAALGIMGLAAMFRVTALSSNLLLWSRLSTRVQ